MTSCINKIQRILFSLRLLSMKKSSLQNASVRKNKTPFSSSSWNWFSIHSKSEENVLNYTSSYKLMLFFALCRSYNPSGEVTKECQLHHPSGLTGLLNQGWTQMSASNIIFTTDIQLLIIIYFFFFLHCVMKSAHETGSPEDHWQIRKK